MTATTTTPRLVAWLTEVMGCGPESIEDTQDGADIRYHWAPINRAKMDQIQPAWHALSVEEDKKPNWIRHRECVSCRWPSDDRFEFSVIIRDPARNIWCQSPEERRQNPKWLAVYCKDCGWVHDMCKCN